MGAGRPSGQRGQILPCRNTYLKNPPRRMPTLKIDRLREEGPAGLDISLRRPVLKGPRAPDFTSPRRRADFRSPPTPCARVSELIHSPRGRERPLDPRLPGCWGGVLLCRRAYVRIRRTPAPLTLRKEYFPIVGRRCAPDRSKRKQARGSGGETSKGKQVRGNK